MIFVVYSLDVDYPQPYDIELFKTKDEALEWINSKADNPEVIVDKIIEGEELVLEPVEVVREYNWKED